MNLEEKMIEPFIKILSIMFCSIHIYFKLTNTNTHNLQSKKLSFILFLILASASFYTNLNWHELTFFVPLILFWLVESYFSSQPKSSFVTVSLAFTISFGSYGFSSFIITLIITLLYPNEHSYPFELVAILSSLLHCTFIFLLFKIKRFRKGIPFLAKQELENFATISCILLSFLSIFFAGNYEDSKIRTIGLIVTIFTLAFLIFWWQAQIKKTYLRRLELQELESLRTEVNELNLVIRQLTEDNEKLSRITHRDNTLINALQDSTIKYLETDFESPTDASIAREKLIRNINTLSTERAGLISSLRKKSKREFDTGLTLLDELLRHMDAKATENNISFSVHLGILLTSFVPKDISEADLVHTVDDLLKNAFKSTATCEKRVVQLQFYKLGKHFVVEVADNGIPFEIHSLTSMGLERLTTYDDGTGIGLMDIWETKEKYRATYHLDEYSSATLFTKKISLTFDKKNRYSIRTWRKNEILQMSRRIDLQIYSENE